MEARVTTYRHTHVPGGSYFFTVMTYAQHPLLADRLNIEALGRAFRRVREERPFVMDAFILLPDHLHCLWRLPEGDAASGNTPSVMKTTGKAIWITSITTP
jgi:putative transposase